jgi:uncharacterized damage-inducible protein DinB
VTEPPYTTLLEEAIEAWHDVRTGILEEARVVPDDRYGWRPTDASRTFAEVLRHILESGLMAAGELSRADGDFTRQGSQDFMEEYAGHLARELAPGPLREQLERTLDEGSARILEAGELHMLQTIRRFDGLPGTRFAWFQHHIAHEMYHRGQLALYVRQMGLVPALTQRIQGG